MKNASDRPNAISKKRHQKADMRRGGSLNNNAANELSGAGAAMPGFLLLTGLVLLMVDYSFAQDSPDPTRMQCLLIRQAVAQYGFAAARRHALEAYGPEAVKTGDKCFMKRTVRARALSISK